MTDAPANTPPPRFSRPRQRLRKAVKWGGLILSILLVAAWVASAWFEADFSSPSVWRETLRSGAKLDSGRLTLWTYPEPPRPVSTYFMWKKSPSLEWHSGTQGTVLPGFTYAAIIPLWMIAFPSLALTIFAWRRDAAHRRQSLLNHCPACGYDRAGLFTPDAVCPECGAAAPTVIRP